MTSSRAGAIALAAVLALGACGTTYVDTTATTERPADTPSTIFRPVDPAAPLPDLLDEISMLMFDLDQRIVDEDADVTTLARIEELWVVAEARIRDADPDDVFNFEQAIELARTGVQRRRPADASKGSKILDDVVDAYFDQS